MNRLPAAAARAAKTTRIEKRLRRLGRGRDCIVRDVQSCHTCSVRQPEGPPLRSGAAGSASRRRGATVARSLRSLRPHHSPRTAANLRQHRVAPLRARAPKGHHDGAPGPGGRTRGERHDRHPQREHRDRRDLDDPRLREGRIHHPRHRPLRRRRLGAPALRIAHRRHLRPRGAARRHPRPGRDRQPLRLGRGRGHRRHRAGGAHPHRERRPGRHAARRRAREPALGLHEHASFAGPAHRPHRRPHRSADARPRARPGRHRDQGRRARAPHRPRPRPRPAPRRVREDARLRL